MSKRYLMLLLITASLSSCQRNQQQALVRPPLFNFNEHFTKEAEQLSKANAILIKTLNKEGKTETLELQHPDWKKELQPFLDLDLNKPALKGSYKIDTLSADPQHVRYIASDSTTVIRNVDFYGTDSIIVNKSISNMYYASAEQLTYHRNGYSITAFIRPKAGKSLAFKLNAIIRKNH